jgi:hypothetical protein
MIKALSALGECAYRSAIAILLVVLMFTASFSIMGLAQEPRPLTHFKVGSVSTELWQRPPQQPTQRVILDSWSINQERLEIPPRVSHRGFHPRL